jgi:hypothetical protein
MGPARSASVCKPERVDAAGVSAPFKPPTRREFGPIGNLPANNTLTAADAELVEAGFRARLAAFGDGRSLDGPEGEAAAAAAPEVPASVAATGGLTWKPTIWTWRGGGEQRQPKAAASVAASTKACWQSANLGASATKPVASSFPCKPAWSAAASPRRRPARSGVEFIDENRGAWASAFASDHQRNRENEKNAGLAGRQRRLPQCF